MRFEDGKTTVPASVTDEHPFPHACVIPTSGPWKVPASVVLPASTEVLRPAENAGLRMTK
jgi:hypothetical protein